MSLIKREKTAVIKRLSVRMERDLLDALIRYAAHMASSKDHIVSEAVRYIIARDKDFSDHQDSHIIPPTNPPTIAPTNPPTIPNQKAAGK